MPSTAYKRPVCKGCGRDPRKYTEGCPVCAERKEGEERWAQRWDKVTKAREAIIAATGGKKGVSGRIHCPACGTGQLAFAVQKNGHISAICETEGCMSWIE